MAKKSKNKKSYPIVMIGGIAWLFLAVIGLFELATLGALVSNVIRFFIGESYDLFLIISLIPAFQGVLQVPKAVRYFTFKRRLGWTLFLISITLLLSVMNFQSFHDLVIFSGFWQEFKSQLIVGQVNDQLHGGLLGTSIYYLLQPLIGFWGMLFLVIFLGVPGFNLLVGVNKQMLVNGFAAMGASLHQLGERTSRRAKEMREVYESSEETSSKIPEAPVDEIAEESEQTATRKSPSRGLLGQFRALFEEEEDHPDVSWETSHRPSFEGEEEAFDPFNERMPLAQTAQEKRQEGPVLDFDYFDHSQDKLQDRVMTNPQPSLTLPREDQTSLDFSDLVHVPQESQVFVEPIDLPPEPEDFEEPLPEDQTVETSPPPVREQAMHWQDQANTYSSVTTNPMDEHLQAGSFEELKPVKKQGNYQLPGKDLLSRIKPVDQSQEYDRINRNIEILEETFESFGVDVKVVKANLGPAVTKYEIEPAIGVRVNRIVSLSDDIALALSATDVRIEAPIPGKALIGIEVPNTQISPVSFAEIIDPALESPKLLEVPLGRDVSGKVCLADLSAMPHLLIAGATGSGKSVGMNVIISSLLMKATPEEIKLLMIDPKMVELTLYNDIPHLLSPVVTNPRKAAHALNKVVQEMERRYELFQSTGVRNVDGFNEFVEKSHREQGVSYEKLPKIVVLVDELADLMLVASNEVETAIIRLAQMARAAGIHMIIATQRPSVDVITGIIKANVPSRLAFAVSSGTDSRTILDANGAEKLLGRGDMLFQPMGTNKPLRVQGAYISDQEVERITNFIKNQRGAEYDASMIVTEEETQGGQTSEDEYFPEAVELIKGQETISISQLQRRFRIGYNRAARLMDDLEAQAFVGPQDGSKPRQVLVQSD